MKHIVQNYYVGFAQDEWHLNPNLTLNYGLRYDFYARCARRDNRIVKFNIDNGNLDPDTTPLYDSLKTNWQPRVAATYNVGGRRWCAAASASSSARARRRTRSSRSRPSASARRCRPVRRVPRTR